jgi:hypothetical protein
LGLLAWNHQRGEAAVWPFVSLGIARTVLVGVISPAFRQ